MKDTRQLVSNLKTLMLKSNDWVPNNPLLPILIYESAFTITGDDPQHFLRKHVQRMAGPHNGGTASTTTITTTPKDMRYWVVVV